MFRPSVAAAALVLAGSVAYVAADAGCESVIATANESGLGALTAALSDATVELAATEFGPVILAAANLDAELPGDQRVTIFAPTDAAFQEAADKLGGDLPQEVLADVLLNHIVAQELTAETIISLLGESGGSVVVPSVLGGDLFVSTDGTSIFVQSQGLEAPGATVTIPDQMTCAGPIHVIDTVLLPTTPEGTIIDFADAPVAAGPVADGMEPATAPDMGPEIAPVALTPATLVVDDGIEPLIPGFAPAETPLSVGDRGLPPFAVADGPLADDPIIAPLEAEPLIAPLGDAPLTAPLIGGIAPLGEEPSIAPVGDIPVLAATGDGPSVTVLGEEPSTAPLGDEPAAGPVVDERSIAPLDDPLAVTPDGADGDLETGDVAGDSAPTVQGEPDAAMSAVWSSAAAAVAAAVLMLVA